MELNFTTWMKWAERGVGFDSGIFRRRGIYALMISDAEMGGALFSWKNDISYIGMTNSVGGIRGRLKQFENSLLDRKGGGHGGAERFRFDYADGSSLAKILYVAICPLSNTGIDLERELLEKGDIARAEYIALALFVKEHGGLPKYNDKKNCPKRKNS